MKKMITGYLIDVYNKKHGPETIKDELKAYYKILDCNMIECANITIDGHKYVAIVDEEGLIEGKLVSGISTFFNQGLFGNIFIVNQGTETWNSLTQEDIDNIKNHMSAIAFGEFKRYILNFDKIL